MEKTFRINPKSVFTLKDMPSCIYRVAFYLTENPYISAQTFFKELSFHESLQLHQMVNLITAEHAGKFTPSNSTEQYMLALARVSLMKCTELLCYGTGDSDIPAEVFMEKLLTFGTMTTLHFMQLTGTIEVIYENFDIDCRDVNKFVKTPPSDPTEET